MSQIAAIKAISRLLCDTALGADDAGLSPGLVLRQNISRSVHALLLWKANNFEVGDGVGLSSYTRRFMESSATALLLRVDPIRVLALREFQKSGEYQLAKRNLLTVQWAGDIIPKGGIKNRLLDCDPEKIDRALFSTVCSLTFWKPALESLQNTLSNYQIGSPWCLELLNFDPDVFAQSVAGQLNSGFSFFSKGIHNEWVDRRRESINSADSRKYCGTAIKYFSYCAAILSSSNNIKQHLSREDVVNLLQVIEFEFGAF